MRGAHPEPITKTVPNSLQKIVALLCNPGANTRLIHYFRESRRLWSSIPDAADSVQIELDLASRGVNATN
jgi:hypothetical protein